jgi:hypothetical protein
MDENTQAPIASEETRKIMEEIREEGDHFPGIDPETKPEVKPDPKPKSDEDEVEEEDGEDTDNEDDEDGEDEEEKKPKAPLKRTSKFVPVKKFNELRHANQDLQRKIAEMQQATKQNDTQPTKQEQKKVFDKASEFAEKLGLEEEAVKEFAEYILGMAQSGEKVLPDDIKEKLDTLGKITSEYEQTRQQQQEDADFEAGFEKLLDERPELADRKKEFKRLAFTEGYENTPLEVLADHFVMKNKIVKTAEPSKRGGGKTKVLDFSNMTEEELDKLDGEDFENYRKFIMKQSGRY